MYLVIREINMFKAAIFDMDGLMMNMDKILIQIYASKKFIQCVQIKSKKKELP